VSERDALRSRAHEGALVRSKPFHHHGAIGHSVANPARRRAKPRTAPTGDSGPDFAFRTAMTMEMPRHMPVLAADALGVLSVASGALLLAAPSRMARLYALPENTSLLRLMGLRDLAIGASLLRSDDRRAATVARALSDVVDFALMAGLGTRPFRETRGRMAGALASALLSLLLNRVLASRAHA